MTDPDDAGTGRPAEGASATARRDALAGARTIAPILLGVIPFGLVAGVAAVEAGLTPVQAVGMSVVVFAGAAQLAAIDLLGRTAPLSVVVLTALVINLRFVMYSASIAPYLRRAGVPARWLGAYLLTDQAYAVSVAEFRANAGRNRIAYYLGAAATLWLPWQVTTAVGAVAGASLPPGLSLEFAVPLTFLALAVPAVEDRPTAVAAGVAGLAAVLAAPLPFDLGLVTAAVAGIAVGVGVDVRSGTFPRTDDDDSDRRSATDRARTDDPGSAGAGSGSPGDAPDGGREARDGGERP